MLQAGENFVEHVGNRLIQRAARNPKTPTEFSLHIFLLFAPFLAPGLKDINQNGPTTLPPHAHVRNLFFGQACRKAGRPFLLCGTSSSENASSIYHDRFPDFSRRDFSPDFRALFCLVPWRERGKERDERCATHKDRFSRS